MSGSNDAVISVIFDATGAKRGADEIQAAAAKVIGADRDMSLSAAQRADAITRNEQRIANERVKATAAAQQKATADNAAAMQQAAVEAQLTKTIADENAKRAQLNLRGAQETARAASLGADGFENATKRIIAASSSVQKMLDGYERAWNPFIAGAQRAQKQMENLLQISQQVGKSGERTTESFQAEKMLPEAARRLNTAVRNQDAGFDVAAETDRLTKAFAPAQSAAAAMAKEIGDLNRALQLGIEVEGGQVAQLARIAAKYDETAKKAAEAAAVIAKMNDALRAAPSAGPGFVRGQGDASMNVSETRALISEFDKGYAATLRFNGAMGRLNELEDAGIQIAGGYGAARAALRVGYEKDMDAVRALLGVYGQQQVMEKVLADRASGTSARGTTAGFSAAQQSMALTDDARKTVRKSGIEEAFNDADAMRARFDTIFANSQKYAKEWEELENVIKTLNLTEVQAAALHDNLSKSIERGIGVVETDAAATAKAATDKAAATQKLVMEFDQGAATTLRFNETMGRLNTLEASGTQIAGGYAAARARLRAGYEQDMAAVRGLLDTYGQQLVMEKVLADRASGSSARGTTAGFSAAGQSMALTDAARKAARQVSLEGAFAGGDKQREEFDSIFASSQRYEQALTRLNETVKILNLSEEQAGVMLDNLNKTIARGVGPVEEAAKAEADKAAALQRSIDKYDVIGAATTRYVAALKEIDALEKSKDLSPEVAAQARTVAKSSLDETVAKNDPAAIAAAEAAKEAKTANDQLQAALQRTADKYDIVAAAERAHAEELARINTLEAAGRLSPELASAARDKEAEALNKVRNAEKDALEAGRMKYDTLYARSKQYEAALNEINALQAKGAFGKGAAGEAGYNRSLEDLNKNFATFTGTATDKTRQLAFAARQVGVQFTQGFSGLITGQGFFTVLIQQGHQLIDVALATGTGFKAIGDAAKTAWAYVVSPIGLAITGVAAVTAAIAILATMAENAGRRLGALRNDLSLFRKDYAAVSAAAEDVARHLAATTNMSLNEARAGVNSVLKTDQFKGQAADAEALVIAARKVAFALGDVGKTADIASKIVANPAGVLADMLTAHPEITAFNQQTVEAVKHLQDLGQQGNAVAMAAGAITRATAKQTEDLTPLLAAWHALERTLTGTGKAGDDLSTKFGVPFLTALTEAVSGVNKLVTAIERLYAQLKEAIPQGFLDFLDKVNTASKYLNPAYLSYKAATGDLPKPAEDTSRKLFDWLTSNQFKAPTPPASSSNAPSTSSATTDGVVQKLFDWLTSNQFKTAPTTTSTSSTEIGGAPGPYNYDRASEIATGLVKRGMEVSDAIAFAANAIRESGGDFKKVNMADAPGGSHGLFQWNKERLTAFQQQNNGLLPEQTSMDRQLDFVKTEVEGQYRSVYQRVKAEQNLEGKTRLVTSEYEVPADKVGQGNISAGIARDMTGRYSGVLNTVASNTKTENQVREAAADIYGKSLEDQRRQEQQKIDDARKALALPGGQDESHVRAYNIQIQESQKRLYDLVTASQAYERELKLTTTGEERIAAAYRISAAEGERMTHQVEAEKTARQQLNPATAEAEALVQRLTAANIRAATAQEHLAMAQKTVQNNNQTESLKLEADLLNVSTVAREKALAQLRIEQDLKAKGISIEDAYAQGLIKSSNAMIDQAAKTNQAKANLQELSGFYETAFNTIGSSIVDAFDNGKSALQNFADLSKTLTKQILNEFLKLAVINPLLNSLFPGTPVRPTLGGVMNAGGAANDNAAGSGGGFWSWLTGGSSSSTGAGAAAGSPVALDNTGLATTKTFSDTWHGGGIVGVDNAVKRFVHPAYFDDAPRFHTGMKPSLAHDEFPAILQRGERVLTAKQDDRVLDLVGRLTAAAMGKNPATVDTHNANQRTHDQFFNLLTKGEEVASARKYHDGGVVGIGGVPFNVSMALFANAPRFHDGGVYADDLASAQSAQQADMNRKVDEQKQFQGQQAIGGAANSALMMASMIAKLIGKDGLAGITKFFSGLGDKASSFWSWLTGSSSAASSAAAAAIEAGGLSAAVPSALTEATSFAAASTFASEGAAIAASIGPASSMAGASAAELAASMTSASLLPTVASAAALHDGGMVGIDGVARIVPANFFDTAPRLHAGSPMGYDEFGAILQRGERVLTAPQQRAMVAAAKDGGEGGGTTNHFNFNLPGIKDRQTSETFLKSAPHIMRQALDEQIRSKNRNG